MTGRNSTSVGHGKRILMTMSSKLSGSHFTESAVGRFIGFDLQLKNGIISNEQ
jgi:hypothetical protein